MSYEVVWCNIFTRSSTRGSLSFLQAFWISWISLIEFELFCGDLVGNQFIGTKRIPQSVKAKRLGSESIKFVNALT